MFLSSLTRSSRQSTWYALSSSPFYRWRNKDTKKLSNFSQVTVSKKWNLCNLVLEFKTPSRCTYPGSSRALDDSCEGGKANSSSFCFVCRVCLFVVLETDLSASFPFPTLLYLKSKLCSSLVRAPIIYLFIYGSVFILVFTVIECTCMNIASALWRPGNHQVLPQLTLEGAGCFFYQLSLVTGGGQ